MHASITYTPTAPRARSDRARNAPLAAAYVVTGKHPASGHTREAVRLELRGSRKAATVHAYLRAMTQNDMATGHGSANGGGYHKPSAAADAAIGAAGYHLPESIAGRGNSPMLKALLAIATYHGFTDTHLVEIED